MHKRMNESDKKTFDVGVVSHDMLAYLTDVTEGTRKFITGETLEDLEYAKRRLRKFAIMGYTAQAVALAIVSISVMWVFNITSIIF